MATFSNGESGSSVRAKLNEIIEKVEGTSLLGNDIKFGDNDKATFGDGSDLQIYHDGVGGSSYITENSASGALLIQGEELVLENPDGTNYFRAATDGSVKLYNSGAVKLNTTSTGVDVTGVITSDGLTLGDAHKAIFGAGSDLQIYHDGFNSYIEDAGTGYLVLKTGGIGLAVESSVHGNLLIAQDDFVKLYNAGSEKLATTSTGVDVTGTVTADGLTVDGQAVIQTSTGSSLLTLKNTDASISGGESISLDMVYGDTANSTSWRTLSRFAGGNLQFLSNIDNAGYTTRMTIAEGGDISFYEDTGTTPKFFWDASAEKARFGGGTSDDFAGSIGLSGQVFTIEGYINNSLVINAKPNASNEGVILQYNGNDGLILNNAGNVGIGTNSPAELIHIAGGAAAAYLKATNSAGTQGIEVGVSAAGDGVVNVQDAKALRLFTTDTERMRIDASGNVGIGTSSPTALLDVVSSGTGAETIAEFGNGNISNGLIIQTNGNLDWGFNATNSRNMTFSTNQTERMRITSTGSVGIGTSSPSYALSVAKTTTGTHAIDAVNNTTGAGSTRLILRNPNSDTDGNGFQIINNANDGVVNLLNYKNTDLALWTNATERMRIDSSGNVGIGTTSPAFSSGSGLRIERDTTATLRLQETGSHGFEIRATISAAEFYSANSKPFTFETGGSEAMRIDSSGNLLVGTTDTSLYNNTSGGGFHASANGFTEVAYESANAADPAFLVNNTGADGDIIQLRKDGTTVGSIGTTSGEITLGSNGTGLRFTDAADRIDPWSISSNVARDAAIDLGTGSRRFKDLYLSGGVYLGGTGAANLLDDYEEGTWTPTFNSSSFATGITVSNAHYVKIGDLVNVTAGVAFTGTTGNFTVGDNYQIGGLPFSMSDTYGRNGSGWASASSNRIGFNNLAQLTYIAGNVTSVYGTLARTYAVTITITYKISAT